MRPFAALKKVLRVAVVAMKAALSLIVASVIWLSLKIVGVFQASAEFEFNRAYERRVLLSDEDMYDLYMARSGVDPNIVSRVRGIFASQFSLDFARILPDDDFGRIYDDLDLCFLFDEIESTFGIDLDDLSLLRGDVRTFSEIVHHKLIQHHGRIVLPPPDDAFAAVLQAHRAYN